MPRADEEDLDGRRFRALASGVYDVITELDATGRVTYVSPDRSEPGRPRDALTGEFGLPNVHPEDRERVAEHFRRLLADAGHIRASFRAFAVDGQLRWVECTGTRFETFSGEPRVLLLTRDVTEQKETETRLHSDQERFQLIAENAYDMISEIDEEGRVLYTNDRVEHLFGPADPAGWARDPSLVLHPDDAPRVRATWKEALSGGEPPVLSYRVSHPDGAWRSIEARYRGVTDSQGRRRVILIARDTSETVESDQRLRKSEERHRQLVESSPLGIVVMRDGVLVYANTAGASICGAARPEDVLGTPMNDLLEAEGARRVGEQLATIEGGGRVPETIELRLHGIDGQVRDVVATGSVIEFEGAPAYQGLIRDVTRLRRVEREHRRLELQLQEARKLESLGLLAGGIAHDFNNLLAVILGNTRFAMRETAGEPELVEALSDAIEAGEQAARLTSQLLEYAGRRSPDVRATDLTELVETRASLLGSALPGHVELRLALDANAPKVRADVVQLEQVLMNLVMNAGEAVDAGSGWVRVATGGADVDADTASLCVGGADLLPGAFAYLEVADSGRGMDEETRDRIFEPFFTTKREGHGLGLAAVQGLVRGHHGAIALDTSRGNGTRLRVYLPALEELPDTPVERGGAVLVLEPDVRAREELCGVLARHRLAVLEAASTEQAIDLQRRHADEIGLAIGDPRDPGSEHALRALRGADPALPLLLLGKPAREGIVAELARSGPAQVVNRPLCPAELDAQLEVLLGKS